MHHSIKVTHPKNVKINQKPSEFSGTTSTTILVKSVTKKHRHKWINILGNSHVQGVATDRDVIIDYCQCGVARRKENPTCYIPGRLPLSTGWTTKYYRPRRDKE